MVNYTTFYVPTAFFIDNILVFDDRYGNTPPFRDAWLPVGLIDAATFHQVLSNAALNLASLRARDHTPETRESMLHHTKAVMLVKQNMSNKHTATSDSIIASITAFACYAVRSFLLE
jgi:Fungal specific transcription factor domain